MLRATALRSRLLLLLLTVVAGVWLLALAAAWYEAHHELDELFDEQLEQTTLTLLELDLEDIPSTVTAPGRGRQKNDDDDKEKDKEKGDEKDEGHDNGKVPTAVPDHLDYQVWHRDGRLLLRSSGAPDLPFDAAEGHRILTQGASQWHSYARWNAEHALLIRVFDGEGHRRELTAEIIGRVALPLVVSLPLLAALIWFAVGRALAPLHALSRAVDTRDADHLAPLRTDGIPDEALPLVRALNELLARLAHSLATEKRFTADAAHELRTPLAGIRAQAQVARGSTDEASRRRALDGIIEGVDRATRLAAQLLTLARADRDAPFTDAALDLAEVARAGVARRAQAALDRDQTLRFDRDGACGVAGDRDLLDALCGNLIDNAIAYVPRGGEIEMTVTGTPDGVTLCVRDDGPGVPADQRDRLLDRFYRVPREVGDAAAAAPRAAVPQDDGKASAATNVGAAPLDTGVDPAPSGSGLGLAIVRQIAQRHHATLTLSGGLHGRGLGVCVRFPAVRS